jgi:hypothetical protein
MMFINLEGATALGVVFRWKRSYTVHCNICNKSSDDWDYENAVSILKEHLTKEHGESEILLVLAEIETGKTKFVDQTVFFSVPLHLKERIARLEGELSAANEIIQELVEKERKRKVE